MTGLTHFSLFTGIGGIDVAAEAAGFETVCQCEWADYPTAVLEKHWPQTPRFKDITTVTKEAFIEKTGKETVTLISGGFPCQPFSSLGQKRGFSDERYLWPEMLRVIKELQPRWVLGENVANFISMGADKTILDLGSAGYSVRVFVLPAVAVGAWHERKRTFIVGASLSNSNCQRYGGRRQNSEHYADPQRGISECQQRRVESGTPLMGGLPGNTETPAQSDIKSRMGGMVYGLPSQMDGRTVWQNEPKGVPRLISRKPNDSKRLKALGNAVVPAQAYPILQYIADIEMGRCYSGYNATGGEE